jgi:hypothetical protein
MTDNTNPKGQRGPRWPFGLVGGRITDADLVGRNWGGKEDLAKRSLWV